MPSDQPEVRSVATMTPDEKARFVRACKVVLRSEAQQLRLLAREFADATLGAEPAETEAAA